MKKIIYIIGVAAAMSIASCQKSEEQNPAVETLTAVTFTSEVTTRVSDTTWETGDEIGVFMYELDYNIYDRYGTNALYYISSGAETTSAKFTSDNPLYYPSNAHMDFVAYYPYAEDTESGVAFTVGSTDQSSEEKLKALDLMVARAASCYDGSSPTLSFERKMSKITFEVNRKDNAKDLVLSELTLSNVISGGSYTIYNTSNANYTKVTAGSTTSAISLFLNESDQVEAIVVPQTATDAKIAVSVGGNTYAGTFSETFEAGMQYTYTLVVGQNEVELSGVTITDWSEVESGEMATARVPYVQFERNQSNTANMTKVDDTGAIENLLSKFRRCLMRADSDGNATICYLDNANSTLYSDGTTATLDGSEGDVMVYFPEFWYKYKNVDDDYFLYYFSESEVDGYVHVDASLVGAYKAYNENDMVYSRSGVTPTVSVSQADFKSYAAARGTGYQIIDYEQHCTIAMMLYAKYLDRNTQTHLGVGGAGYNTNNTTGSTNTIGNADTSNETSNWVNGLGIEGVFGGVYEWVQGVEISNRVWSITNPSESSTRKVTAGSSSDYITTMAIEGYSGDDYSTQYFDMVPTAVGGSTTTYYADYYSQNNGIYVLARSCSSSSTYGGVAYSSANLSSSNAFPGYGSRLAFRGTITEAASVDAYKALFD